ncbi:hypothetical protein KCP73_14495 [Salmonella enterica subsp. enterica]|nr:hypothetical protein KCP73_14495 [Salmonella enterica subsp. enterica]
MRSGRMARFNAPTLLYAFPPPAGRRLRRGFALARVCTGVCCRCRRSRGGRFRRRGWRCRFRAFTGATGFGSAVGGFAVVCGFLGSLNDGLLQFRTRRRRSVGSR